MKKLLTKTAWVFISALSRTSSGKRSIGFASIVVTSIIVGFGHQYNFALQMATNGTSSPASQTLQSALNIWSSNGPAVAYKEQVSAVVVDPNNPNIIYAGTSFWYGGGSGVFKSATNGASWSESSLGLEDPEIWQIAIDTANPAFIYARTRTGLFRSTNGGSNWTRSTAPGKQFNMLAIAPSDPNTIYVGNETYPNIYKLLVSTDRGTTWSERPLPIPPVYPHGALTVHPQDPSIIYASGYGSACRSNNGGVSWGCGGYGVGYLAKTHSIEINPNNPKIIYAGTDEGLYKSINGGGSWILTGLIDPMWEALVIDPVDPEVLYAAPTDGPVYKSTDGGTTWNAFNNGLGGGVIDLAFDRSGRFLHAATLGGVFDVQVRATVPSISIADFDGDGKSDISVFRPTTNEWHIAQSGGGTRVQAWGLNGDKIVPADYDGDGKTDLAVFRESDSNWYALNSSNNTVTVAGWGLPGDQPVPFDYGGDGKADFAVYRPSESKWYRRDSDGQLHISEWGLPSDKPAPADFDGDGITDLTVFRPSNGTWYTINSSSGAISEGTWGIQGDLPVPADYSGDGKADFAVFRPSDKTWYRRHTNDHSIHIITWGLEGDVPAPGDFDGDGKTDLTVYRPSNGTWYIFGSRAGIYAQPWGLLGDIPTPNAYVY